MCMENLSEEDLIRIAAKAYKNYKKGRKIKINGKTFGYVAKVVNDPKTGEQAYIIVPNNPKAKNYDLKKVKNVAVLYCGSTGADKLFKKEKNWS
ncbi:hypothetical protein [Ligilactobacillus acidipiscis]|uniref:hypothetical protein n=1 Tax=Ligilactobacillus acidipiscis TaxID=89059 RepID=UPI0023FA1381|nr:hypothetical protein [Ligilactobacillus acidipiscis]WEV56439.1 hypothetical protein OZX66_09425 [Ligilactobacillus acidipiscis]